MFATPEQFAATNKANVETLLTLANNAFASAERFAALNLNTARSILEDGLANSKALLGAKDAQEFLGLQAALVQPLVEKAVAYNRSVYEIASQGQEEVSKLVEAQVAELNKSVAAALDKAAKSLRPVRTSPLPPSSRPSPPPTAPTTASARLPSRSPRSPKRTSLPRPTPPSRP